MLSDRSIKTAKPAAKHQFIADGKGLYLRVHPSGKKQFVYRSRKNGKARWVALGDYPAMSLLVARQRALDMAGAALPDAATLQTVYASYTAVIGARYERFDLIDQRVTANLMPDYGTRLVHTITRREMATLLQDVAHRAPVLANRLLADMKHIFQYAVEAGYLSSSPVAAITRNTVGGDEKSKTKALDWAEIRAFIRLMLPVRFHLQTRLSLGLLLLTGLRASEVIGLDRSEIRDDWWHVPRRRMKNKDRRRSDHKVYMSRQTRGLLRMAFKWFGHRPFDGMDHRTLSRALLRAGVGYTPHDFRRTMATRMPDLGVPPHVIEKMLDHQMEGVMAVYNHAEYLPERKAAMILWGSKLSELRVQAKKEPGEAPGSKTPMEEAATGE